MGDTRQTPRRPGAEASVAYAEARASDVGVIVAPFARGFDFLISLLEGTELAIDSQESLWEGCK